jgi:hypothetical protein
MVKLVQKIDSIILIDPSNKTVMTGKLSGQFFTNAAMKGVMLDFIQPKVFEDPAMSTAEYLTKYFWYISEGAKEKSDVRKIADNGLIEATKAKAKAKAKASHTPPPPPPPSSSSLSTSPSPPPLLFFCKIVTKTIGNSNIKKQKISI